MHDLRYTRLRTLGWVQRLCAALILLLIGVVLSACGRVGPSEGIGRGVTAEQEFGIALEDGLFTEWGDRTVMIAETIMLAVE